MPPGSASRPFLGVFGHWLRAFPLTHGRLIRRITQAIKDYRDGNPIPLERFVLHAFAELNPAWAWLPQKVAEESGGQEPFPGGNGSLTPPLRLGSIGTTPSNPWSCTDDERTAWQAARQEQREFELAQWENRSRRYRGPVPMRRYVSGCPIRRAGESFAMFADHEALLRTWKKKRRAA